MPHANQKELEDDATALNNKSLLPLTVRFVRSDFRVDGDAVFDGNGRSFDGNYGGGLFNIYGGTVMYGIIR